MEEGNVIEVRNVSKKFRVYSDRGHSLKEKMLSLKRNKYEEKQVLKDISFDVRRGESVGLIGHNGCGKSTMLKMLTRIMYPDSGTIEIEGKVSSLLELGAGFHPDMSGRENIYINASIFGLSRSEINDKLQEIIAFSELEEYIDNPVRTYSSGMYMRLAFAVAINVNADVLIVDEILAVGDINFQRKCLNKMREIQNQGTTVVLVSHSMDQILDVCDRCVWIHEGLVAAVGESRKVAKQYLTFMEQQNRAKDVEAKERQIEYAGEISDIGLLINGQQENSTVHMGDRLTVCFRFSLKKSNKFCVNMDIVREDCVLCFTRTFDNEGAYYEADGGEIHYTFESLPLLPGRYFVNLHMVADTGLRLIDEAPVLEFRIEGSADAGGIVMIPTACQLDI